MNCHFLLQGIFLTQGWNLGLLHCGQILYHLAIREAVDRARTSQIQGQWSFYYIMFLFLHI